MSEREGPRMALLTELCEAVAADLSESPQRCGHSSDPLCCPYVNFPTLADLFSSLERPSPVPERGETEPNLTGIQQAIEAFGRLRYEEGRAHGEAAASRMLATTPTHNQPHDQEK